MSENLFRQRRNLMITSLILFVVFYTNIQITEISFLGVKTNSFKNEDFRHLLLFIHIYFLIRYIQFFNEEEIPSHKTYSGIRLEYISDKITKEILNENFDDFSAYPDTADTFIWTEENIKKLRQNVLTYLRISQNNKYVYDPHKGNPQYEGQLSKTYSITKFNLIIYSLLSILKTYLSRTYLTNYLFPILFALSQLAYFFY